MKSPIALLLNQAINRALKYDRVSQKQLKPHIGKRVAINIEPIGLKLHMHIMEQGIEVTGPQEEPANTTITGKPTALFAMASSQHIASLDQVVINGDAGLGQFIADFLKNLNPDTEEALCDLLGDTPGFQISQALKKAQQKAQEIGASFKRNLTDYWVHEDRSLIATTEMEQFLDEVDDLQADVTRIERRINEFKSGD